MAKVRAHIFVSGRVQGIFYRSNTRDKATSLGIKGWVRNLHDGRVEAVFEGGRANVKEMVEWCRTGPPFARVDNVEVEWEAYKGEFESFGVRYDPL